MRYENERFENLRCEGELLEDRIFEDCVFYKCKFCEMELRHCSFRSCTFEACTILNNGAGLKDTDFQQNNLIGADFREASDYNISLENNKLKKTEFSFPEAVRLLASTGIIVE